MGKNKPIEIIPLYINRLDGFLASFSQKMNAQRGRSVKDSEKELRKQTQPANALVMKEMPENGAEQTH